MSTRSSILCTPACHIYRDYAYQHTEKTDIDGDKQVLVIDVSYGSVDYEEYEDQASIVVDWDSDFAKMVRLMIDKCGAKWIESMHRAEGKVESIDISAQPEPLKTILKGLVDLGNDVKMVDGILTINAK